MPVTSRAAVAVPPAYAACPAGLAAAVRRAVGQSEGAGLTRGADPERGHQPASRPGRGAGWGRPEDRWPGGRRAEPSSARAGPAEPGAAAGRPGRLPDPRHTRGTGRLVLDRGHGVAAGSGDAHSRPCVVVRHRRSAGHRTGGGLRSRPGRPVPHRDHPPGRTRPVPWPGSPRPVTSTGSATAVPVSPFPCMYTGPTWPSSAPASATSTTSRSAQPPPDPAPRSSLPPSSLPRPAVTDHRSGWLP